ncbi:MAG: hypothetical protein P0Y53_13130 [Candidatus Pseudobacter hemicellulosilyticus]|uniref:Uncharacterized protein n=1 Tax=Candidatus Pseudobacter hemicellulosilyticus TaxID=3121375 RepID=A0AAJ5WN22_9BACT|nr:MAG: hypothetical protein P0Y53_13130 [Pseudobacter sp.]
MHRLFIVGCLLFALAACEKEGSAGPEGPAGPPGNPGRNGNGGSGDAKVKVFSSDPALDLFRWVAGDPGLFTLERYRRNSGKQAMDHRVELPGGELANAAVLIYLQGQKGTAASTTVLLPYRTDNEVEGLEYYRNNYFEQSINQGGKDYGRFWIGAEITQAATAARTPSFNVSRLYVVVIPAGAEEPINILTNSSSSLTAADFEAILKKYQLTEKDFGALQ